MLGFRKKCLLAYLAKKGVNFGYFAPLPPPEGVRGAMQDPTFPKSYQLSLLNVIQEYNDHFKLSPKKGFFWGVFLPPAERGKKIENFFSPENERSHQYASNEVQTTFYEAF